MSAYKFRQNFEADNHPLSWAKNHPLRHYQPRQPFFWARIIHAGGKICLAGTVSSFSYFRYVILNMVIPDTFNYKM